MCQMVDFLNMSLTKCTFWVGSGRSFPIGNSRGFCPPRESIRFSNMKISIASLVSSSSGSTWTFVDFFYTIQWGQKPFKFNQVFVHVCSTVMRCDPNEIPWLETVDKGNVGHVGTARCICREQLKTKRRNGDVSLMFWDVVGFIGTAPLRRPHWDGWDGPVGRPQKLCWKKHVLHIRLYVYRQIPLTLQ